jgi:hypothetical protein
VGDCLLLAFFKFTKVAQIIGQLLWPVKATYLGNFLPTHLVTLLAWQDFQSVLPIFLSS